MFAFLKCYYGKYASTTLINKNSLRGVFPKLEDL